MVDSQCLACYTDGIWYPATVTDVKDDLVSVHFDDYGEDMEVDMTQVVPSGESSQATLPEQSSGELQRSKIAQSIHVTYFGR